MNKYNTGIGQFVNILIKYVGFITNSLFLMHLYEIINE
jgi:hypothetical protein